MSVPAEVDGSDAGPLGRLALSRSAVDRATQRRSDAEWIEAAWADPARLAQARSASPLTAREHEIVVLIARGLSNRQIADELVISPATAARHVANILAKLGFTSRTQVASWAARHEPSS